MTRTCPSCKSPNARRSAVRAAEITFRHIFLSPYRCRDCRTRFWVVSRNSYYLAVIIVVAILVGAVAWNLSAWVGERNPDAAKALAKAPANAPRIADLVELANGNDAAAEFELYRVYDGGTGVAKNAKEAYKWLERSARHGNTQAQYELGAALREGREIVQDFDAAHRWIRMAAEGGNGQAQYTLGTMYRAGVGVAVDDLEAYVWLNVAAAQGVPGAAAVRDMVLARLSPAELQAAQAEARRRSAIEVPEPGPGPGPGQPPSGQPQR